MRVTSTKFRMGRRFLAFGSVVCGCLLYQFHASRGYAAIPRRGQRFSVFRSVTTSYSSTVALEELKSLIATLKEFCGADNYSGSGSLPLKCMMDDLEVELLYFTIRTYKPSVVWEISPAHGYSTTVILTALNMNGQGTLYSFDVMDSSKKHVPPDLHSRWKLVIGDAMETVLSARGEARYPYPDFLLLDSVHSREFGVFYITKLLPALNVKQFRVALHDVYNPTLYGEDCSLQEECKSMPSVEGVVVTDWLGFHHISSACEAWTASPFKLGNQAFFESILRARQAYGLANADGARGNADGANPTIFFRMGCTDTQAAANAYPL